MSCSPPPAPTRRRCRKRSRASAGVSLAPVEDRLASLLDARLIATLATTEPDGSAYLSAVWFLRDGDDILVATGGLTRKALNAAERPRASLLIDTRGPGALRGVAATGAARVVRGADALVLNERVWAK